jgi:hypothetical protein
MGCFYSKDKDTVYYIVIQGHNNNIIGLTLDYDIGRKIYKSKENEKGVELIEVHISKKSGLVTEAPVCICHNYPYL